MFLYVRVCAFIRSIRQCTRLFLQQFFHGQTGALFTMNNLPAAFRIRGIFFVYSTLLMVPVHRKVSDQWWLGRLNFISETFAKYGDYYFPQEDIPLPDYYSGRLAPTRFKEPVIPVTDEETLTVLTLVWRFAAVATTACQNRHIKMIAVQIYINTLQLVRNFSRGLERARELLSWCYYTVVDEIKAVIDGYQKKLDQLKEESPFGIDLRDIREKFKHMLHFDSSKPSEGLSADTLRLLEVHICLQTISIMIYIVNVGRSSKICIWWEEVG